MDIDEETPITTTGTGASTASFGSISRDGSGFIPAAVPQVTVTPQDVENLRKEYGALPLPSSKTSIGLKEIREEKKRKWQKHKKDQEGQELEQLIKKAKKKGKPTPPRKAGETQRAIRGR